MGGCPELLKFFSSCGLWEVALWSAGLVWGQHSSMHPFSACSQPAGAIGRDTGREQEQEEGTCMPSPLSPAEPSTHTAAPCSPQLERGRSSFGSPPAPGQLGTVAASGLGGSSSLPDQLPSVPHQPRGFSHTSLPSLLSLRDGVPYPAF